MGMPLAAHSLRREKYPAGNATESGCPVCGRWLEAPGGGCPGEMHPTAADGKTVFDRKPLRIVRRTPSVSGAETPKPAFH